MATKIKRLPLQNLKLGIITDANPLEIPPGAAAAASNVVWVNGSLRGRAGFLSTYVLPVAQRIQHLLIYQTASGVKTLCAITLDVPTGIGGFWKNVAGVWTLVSAIGIGYLSVSIPVTSGNFAGITYFTTGNGPIHYFDGAVVGLLSTLVTAGVAFAPADQVKLLVAGDARIFAANLFRSGVELGYRLEWSDFGVANVWGGAIQNQGGTSGGTLLPKNSDPITGLYADSSVVMVFRPREVYLAVEVGAPAEYNIRCFVQGPGCAAHATIKPYRDGTIVWLGDDNVYASAPGQQPTPIGDRIRTRLRSVVQFSGIGNSTAVMDYDNHLYTLFLPDLDTGLNTKMFTVNLRNGGWWEGDLADPSMAITCSLSWRVSPWETKNLVGTTDGRILETSLNLFKDDNTLFPCSWTSGILNSKSIFGVDHEQACVETLRVVAQELGPNIPPALVTFSVNAGNGIDHLTNTPFVGTQTLDGVSELFCKERVTAENFQVVASSVSSKKWPLVAQIEVGAIPQGMSR